MSRRVDGSDQATEESPFLRKYHPHLPGVTVAWLAHVNSVSSETIRRWRRATCLDEAMIRELTREINVESALEMALLRPRRAILPHWSRLAIAQLHAEGADYKTLCKLFRCSRNTIWRAIKLQGSAYCPLTGERTLTSGQRAPMTALKAAAVPAEQ